MPTQTEIVNAALIANGADPVQSLSDGTTQAEIAAAHYPFVRDALLAGFPWDFAEKRADLAQLTTAQDDDFEYSYSLPADFLRARGISRPDGSYCHREHYVVRGLFLSTDLDAVSLLYTFRAPEHFFPAWFNLALIHAMAAAICIPLTEDTGRAERLQQRADVEIKRARLVDSQQDPAEQIETGALIGVRFGLAGSVRAHG